MGVQSRIRRHNPGPCLLGFGFESCGIFLRRIPITRKGLSMSRAKLARLVARARELEKRPKKAFESAVKILDAYCTLNGIQRPSFSEVSLPGGSRGEYRYYHDYGLVIVDAAACGWYWWSKPGNKADVTEFGVMAHELGHHVHYTLMGGFRMGIKRWMTGPRHKSITSYAKSNTGEQIAEAHRLFVLNPNLLRELSPASYTFFTEKLGLKHA